MKKCLDMIFQREEMKYEPFRGISVDRFEPVTEFERPKFIHEEKLKNRKHTSLLTSKDLDLKQRTTKVKFIVVHCTASGPDSTAEANQRYMLSKWRIGGYNVMIKRNGDVIVYYPASQLTNGVKGHNSETWHVSWVGGVDNNLNVENNITSEQLESLRRVCFETYSSFSAQCSHEVEIVGHNFFEKSRDCPVIDWEKEIVPYVYGNSR